MKRTIGDFLPTSLRAIERTYQGKEWPAGILTGFTDLDFMTGGIRRELTVFGAAPSMGLSSLARQIGMNMARAGHRGAIFDFEMTPEMTTRRLLAMEAGIADMKLRTGLLKRDELGQLLIAAGKIDDVPLMLEERTLYTISELCERIRGLSYEDSCEWVIIDRFDHILPDDGDTSAEEDIENISRALRSLLEELKISIIVLCRVTGDTTNRFPGIAFHHELDALLKVADTALFLRRTDTDGSEYFPMELSILQQRDGPVGSVFYEFSPRLGTFRECPVSADEPDKSIGSDEPNTETELPRMSEFDDSVMMLGDYIDEDDLADASKRFPAVSGYGTGLSALDGALGGIRNDLTAVASRPGVGKTALLAFLAGSLAAAGIPGVFFALEMMGATFAKRMLAHSRDPVATTDLPIIVDDALFGIEEISARLRALREAGLARWAMIDYLGLVRACDGTLSAPEQGRELVQWLAALRQELGIPILFSLQLPRGSDDTPPILQDSSLADCLVEFCDSIIVLSTRATPDMNRKWRDIDVSVSTRDASEIRTVSVQLNARTGDFRDMVEP